MKTKFILNFLLAFICLLLFSSCTGFKDDTKNLADSVSVYHDYDGVVKDFSASTIDIQSLHRQLMYDIVHQLQDYGRTAITDGKYKWLYSKVILSDTVTTDNIDGLQVVCVNDAFSYFDSKLGLQVQYISDHSKYGTQVQWPITDVFNEYKDISRYQIKISAEEALLKLKEWNGTIPNGFDFIILKLPASNKSCNPQWIFGNGQEALFIDAVTGEIRDYDRLFGTSI